MNIPSDLIGLAQDVDLAAIRAYLSAREWKIEGSPEGKLLRLEPPAPAGDEGVFAVIPSSRDFEDYGMRVSELALLVGEIENRPGEDVLRDMAAESTADTRPLPPDGPFHYRGYIGPQHAEAWKAMKWHEEVIHRVLRDFDRQPPEYVLVRAPALSGKTTFAMQLMAHMARLRPGVLPVYLPLGGADASHLTFLQGMRDALADRLKEHLDSAALSTKEDHQFRRAADSWAGPRFDKLRDLLHHILWVLPEIFQTVIFILDDIESLPVGERELVAEDLRSIHTSRSLGPLSKFGVLVLARSLLRYPPVVSPLSNVLREYRLDDFTLEEAQAFLDRCGYILGGLRFDSAAVRYLYEKTAGQAIAIQQICAAARKKTQGRTVETADILEGVSQCFDQGGGFVERVLDLRPLTDEAKMVLDRMLREDAVLPCASGPAVAQLVDLGIAKVSSHHRCVCRSPLLRELLVARYHRRQDSPTLMPDEVRLLGLPQVLPLLCNDPLLDELCASCLNKRPGEFSINAETVREAMMLIQSRCSEIDMQGIQYSTERYYGDLQGPPSRDEVLRVLAKAYLHDCKQGLQDN